MKKYMVSIEGKNFIIDAGTGPQKMGFSTIRYVNAKDPEEAAQRAVDLIRNDDEIKVRILNKRDNPPVLYVNETLELSSFKGAEASGEGYALYPEEERETPS